nr:MAG TPA: hypothetical protein [Caudoviricetes sp.]
MDQGNNRPAAERGILRHTGSEAGHGRSGDTQGVLQNRRRNDRCRFLLRR